MTAPLPTWLTLPSHHEWLDRDFASVMAFNLASILPEGGFAWLGAEGQPLPGKRPQLFLAARMAHGAAKAVARGSPGSGECL